jgi:hypothetical protein
MAISSGDTSVDHPSQMIAGLNSTLCHQTKGQYATAVYAYLDEANRTGRYSTAGHPPPLLWRKATQRLLPLREGGLLLGVRSDEAYPEEEFLLEPRDRLLIYTDGCWRQPVRKAWNLEVCDWRNSLKRTHTFRQTSLPGNFSKKCLRGREVTTGKGNRTTSRL